MKNINKEAIIEYINELYDKAESNERTLKDYIEHDENEPDDMTPEEKYDSDLNQREQDLDIIIKLINYKNKINIYE